MSLGIVLVPITIATVGTVADIISKAKQEVSKKDSLELELKEKIHNHGKSNLENIVRFNSQIKNQELLEKAITQYGCKLVDEKTDELKTLIDKGEILFEKNKEETFDIIFMGDFTQEDIKEIYNEIYENYTSIVQEEVYNKIKEKAKENNYKIESEQVTDNDSIVLTLEF